MAHRPLDPAPSPTSEGPPAPAEPPRLRERVHDWIELRRVLSGAAVDGDDASAEDVDILTTPSPPARRRGSRAAVPVTFVVGDGTPDAQPPRLDPTEVPAAAPGRVAGREPPAVAGGSPDARGARVPSVRRKLRTSRHALLVAAGATALIVPAAAARAPATALRWPGADQAGGSPVRPLPRLEPAPAAPAQPLVEMATAPPPLPAPPASVPVSLGGGASGFTLRDVRFGLRGSALRAVFDISRPPGAASTASPSVTVDLRAPDTVVVAFSGLVDAQAEGVSDPPRGVAVRRSRLDGRTVYEMRLDRPVRVTPAYLLSPLRLVLDLQPASPSGAPSPPAPRPSPPDIARHLPA